MIISLLLLLLLLLPSVVFVCWSVRLFVNIQPMAALAGRRPADGGEGGDQHRTGVAGASGGCARALFIWRIPDFGWKSNYCNSYNPEPNRISYRFHAKQLTTTSSNILRLQYPPRHACTIIFIWHSLLIWSMPPCGEWIQTVIVLDCCGLSID